MKRVIILFLVINAVVKAQVVFCPPGAEWTYYYELRTTNYQLYAHVNDKIKYVRDSVLGADTVKVLEHSRYFSDGNLQFNKKISVIKQKHDSVLVRNFTTQNQWQLLYYYGATPGKKWTNWFVNEGSVVVQNTLTVINLVATATINGVPIKRMTVELKSNSFNTPELTQLSERFGYERFLFYWHGAGYNGLTPWETGSVFICYKDNQMGTFNASSLPCNYSNPVGIKEHLSNKFSLIPNPASDAVEINLDAWKENADEITITDVTGKEIERIKITSSKTTVRLTEFKPGLYFVNLFTEGKITSRQKLLVQ